MEILECKRVSNIQYRMLIKVTPELLTFLRDTNTHKHIYICRHEFTLRNGDSVKTDDIYYSQNIDAFILKPGQASVNITGTGFTIALKAIKKINNLFEQHNAVLQLRFSESTPGEPERVPVQPESTLVQPESTLVQPESTLVQPELTPVQSKYYITTNKARTKFIIGHDFYAFILEQYAKLGSSGIVKFKDRLFEFSWAKKDEHMELTVVNTNEFGPNNMILSKFKKNLELYKQSLEPDYY